MKVRLIHYLKGINFQYVYQYGFTKGQSTEDALLNFVNNVYDSMNKDCKTTGVFVDFKKAFDLVNHEVLLGKMENVGIRGVALQWFRSFLIGRVQQVKIKNQLSTPMVVKAGVPQGSVIAANLFIVFINDLLKQSFSGSVCAFADDIAFLYSDRHINNLFLNIQCDLNVLREWCVENKMSVNADKTKYVNFGHKGFKFQNDVKYHTINCFNTNICQCPKLEQVNSFKYLGVMLDERMSWKIHIQNLHSTLRRRIRQFYYLRNFCKTELLRTLYFALIHSRIQYGIVCWGGACKVSIDRIRVTQNMYLRIIMRKRKRDSSFPLFLELNILPVQYLFVFKILRLFYIRSGNTGTIQNQYEVRSNFQRTFRKPKVKKQILKKSFLFIGPHYFNQLPLNLKKCKSANRFCIEVKRWLFNFENIDFLNQVLA